MLEVPDNILIEKSLKFEIKDINNHTGYEVLIDGMALEVGTSNLKANSDSQLVGKKVSNEYQMKEPRLIKYLKKVFFS